MLLSEIFDQLTYGELSQVALVDEFTGTIEATRFPALVAHTNLGLTSLYKRFALKEGRAFIKLRANQVRYPLSSQEDVLGEGGDDFKDDVLKIEQVLADTGFTLGLNDGSDPYACSTPSANVLRVALVVANQGPTLPDELKTTRLEVVYRANHGKLVYTAEGFQPENINIELPDAYLEPLLLFIASRVHNPIGMTNEFHAGNSYYAKYEVACKQLEQSGLAVDQGSGNSRMARAGWI